MQLNKKIFIKSAYSYCKVFLMVLLYSYGHTKCMSLGRGVVKIEYCKECNSFFDLQSHHIIFRSQSRGLINCKLNQVKLCKSCHDFLHKDKRGYKLDYKLKKEYQGMIELLFIGQAFTLKEIQEVLKINYKAVYGLSKLMKIEKDKYTRESIIIALCGGKLVQERFKDKVITE